MKKRNLLRLALFIVLASLPAAGCAKKPTAALAPVPAAPEAPAIVEPAEEPAGIEAEPVTAAPVEEVAPRPEPAPELLRIYFEFDQYTLTPEARNILADNAASMKSHPGLKVVIDGYCDERGSDEYNLALGERRASAVRNFLISLGVEPERLSTISYGEENPLEPGHDEESWAQNRRAEFKSVL